MSKTSDEALQVALPGQVRSDSPVVFGAELPCCGGTGIDHQGQICEHVCEICQNVGGRLPQGCPGCWRIDP